MYGHVLSQFVWSCLGPFVSCLVLYLCHVLYGRVVHVQFCRALVLYCVAVICRVLLVMCIVLSCIAMPCHAMQCLVLPSLALYCIVLPPVALSCLRIVLCCHVPSCHTVPWPESRQYTTRHVQIRHGKAITTRPNDTHTALEGLSLSSLPARGRPTLHLGLHHASPAVTVSQPHTG